MRRSGPPGVEKQEPIGEYRCELMKDGQTGEKTVLRVFVPYKAAGMIKMRLEEEQAEAKRLRTPK